MDFASFVGRAEPFALPDVPADQLKRIARLFERKVPLETLATKYAADIGAHSLDAIRTLQETWHEYRSWLKAVRLVASARLEAGKTLLVDDALRATWEPTGLRAIEAVAETLTEGGDVAHSTWRAVLEAAAAMWREALATAWREGHVKAEVAPGAALPRATLARLARLEGPVARADTLLWLEATGLAVQERVTLHLDLAEAAVREAAIAAAPETLPDGIDPAAVFDTQLAPWLGEAVLSALDGRARVAGVVTSASRYEAILRGKPSTAPRARIASAGPDDAGVGLAVVSSDGAVVALEHLPLPEDPAEGEPGADDDAVHALAKRAAEWLWGGPEAEATDLIVVPAEDDPLGVAAYLATEADAEGFTVHRVSMAGMDEALAHKRERQKAPRAARAALVLADRTFLPRRAWASLDPAELELVPEAHTLPPERLAAAMEATARIVLGAEAAPAPPKSSGGPPSGAAAIPNGELNPDVRSIRDLRQGMTLRGKVTNVNRLGAFVQLGLPVEGLLPMQSLQDKDTPGTPRDVRRGQLLELLVTSVDKGRQRIRLELRRILAEAPRGERGGGGNRRGARRGRGGPRRGGRRRGGRGGQTSGPRR